MHSFCLIFVFLVLKNVEKKIFKNKRIVKKFGIFLFSSVSFILTINQREITIKRLHQKYSINTSIIFWMICYLCVFTPYNFSTLCNHTKFTNIDLNLEKENLDF